MYGNYPQPSSGNKGSGIYRAASAIGAAIGIAASILLSPFAFDAVSLEIYSLLLPFWGYDMAYLLTLVMGGVIAFLIYAVTHAFCTFQLISWIASEAARKFPEQ